jgi:hypothetical protein
MRCGVPVTLFVNICMRLTSSWIPARKFSTPPQGNNMSCPPISLLLIHAHLTFDHINECNAKANPTKDGIAWPVFARIPVNSGAVCRCCCRQISVTGQSLTALRDQSGHGLALVGVVDTRASTGATCE